MHEPRLSVAPRLGLALLLLAVCGCGREEKARLEEELAQAQALEAEHRAAFRELEAKYHALERRASQNEVDRARLTGELAAATARGKALEGDLAAARDRITRLEEQYRKAVIARDAFQDRLTVAEKDRDNALKEIEKLTEDITRYVEVLTKIKERTPEIYPGGEWLRQEPRLPDKPIRGKVTAVDKKLGLVVFNAGRQKGVRKGDHFVVSRKGKRVGKIVVDETFPDVSAAHYLRDQMATDVEVGDAVLEQPRDAAKEEAERRQRELGALRKRILDLEREQRRLAVALDDARERLRAAGAAPRADQGAAADPQFLAAQRVLKLLKAEVEARGPGAFPLPDGGLRPAHKALRAKILAVDNPVGLAVLNVGQREGCEAGYEFIVSRRGKPIGSIVIIEVFPDLSAARFLNARMKGAVHAGDDATARMAEL